MEEPSPKVRAERFVASWRKKHVDSRGVGAIKMPAAAEAELIDQLARLIAAALPGATREAA